MDIEDLKVPGRRARRRVAAPSKAWTGTDPRHGAGGAVADRTHAQPGVTFAASGEGWTEEQLVHLLLTGERG